MTGTENAARAGSQSGDDSIDLDHIEQTVGSCCGGVCSRTCGCLCAACRGRMSIPIGKENTSNYAGQGGHDQRPVGTHAITISPANNSLTMRDSFQDLLDIGNNSYEAPCPRASPLTRGNIKELERQLGERSFHDEWLAQHWEDVDQNPDAHFNSPVEEDGFDAARLIEGDTMDESIHSLDVGPKSMSQSISMLSQYESSFSRASGSPTMFLPDMRGSLVHRPLPLVPECHQMAANHFLNHAAYHHSGG